MVGVRTPIGRYRGIQPIELDWTRGQLLVLGNTSVISNPINTQTDWVAEIACDNPCWYTIAPAGTSAVPVAAKAGAGSQYLPPNSPKHVYIPVGGVIAVISASGAGNFTIVPSFPGVTGTTPFLLDQFSSAATAAFAVRKLRAAYTGGCVTIRRGSDGTTATIGFTPAGDFDVTGYTSFVGLSGGGFGNGFVTTWFDQTTNGNNAAQATAALQPKIALNVTNGRPALLFVSSAAQWIATTATFTFTAPFTFSAVSSQITTGAYGNIIGINDTTFFPSMEYNNSIPANVYTTANAITDITSSNTFNAGAWTSAQAVFNNSLSSLSVNGAVVTGTNGSLNSETGLTLTMGGQLFGNPLNGYLPEALYFQSGTSSSGTSILTANQRAYYGF